MSYEQKTRIHYEMPRGDWTVVARLTDFSGLPYNIAHADFMRGIIGLAPNEADVDEDGNLFAALKTFDSAGEAVIQETASKLYKVVASFVRLELDPEIVALTVPASQLSRELDLSVSFHYLDQDVSYEMRQEMDSMRGQALDRRGVDAEFEHLLDA